MSIRHQQFLRALNAHTISIYKLLPNGREQTDGRQRHRQLHDPPVPHDVCDSSDSYVAQGDGEEEWNARNRSPLATDQLHTWKFTFNMKPNVKNKLLYNSHRTKALKTTLTDAKPRKNLSTR
jgi:hypothetical protein